MTPRTVLIVAVAALAGITGYWIGTRRSQLSTDEVPGTTDASSGAQTPGVPSFPPAAIDSDARFAALALEPVDDPQPALKKALSLNNESARRQQLTRIGWAWARTSPEEAWKQAGSVGDPAARFQFLSAVVAAWASEDPERAFASVAAMPADWQREPPCARSPRLDRRLRSERLPGARGR